jgi:DcuC family C4-dicarboxylate transporter
MTLFAGLVVIVLAVWAIVRRVEVRLTLLLAALALGCLAGHPEAIVQTFLTTLVSERFVIPIACSLGFVFVLRQTGCDRHLVHLLVRPIQRVRPLLIPGTVVVGAVVNVPVISQMSTAVLVGTVLVPLLRAARIAPVTIGAALLLGSSLGGDLLNPGAPEVRTISEAANVPFSASRWIAHVLPLFAIELTVATAIFWLLSRDRQGAEKAPLPNGRGSDEAKAPLPDGRGSAKDSFRINFLKAAIPFVPIALLFATALPEPFRLLSVPVNWLVDVAHFKGTESELQAVFDSRLIGAAMLVGVAAAALTERRHIPRTAQTFFEGVAFAFKQILSLIAAASCFGEGIKLSGLAMPLGRMLQAWPQLLTPAALVLPLSFGALCGSGMATTQSLFGFFVEPARQLGCDPLHLGAMIALAASTGRTLSPVAAVTLTCASLTEVNPLQLVRRLALPLLAGLLAVLAASRLFG